MKQYELNLSVHESDVNCYLFADDLGLNLYT